MSTTAAAYCTFHIAGHLFGVDILDVREVTTEIRATPIPQAPDEVLGYINLRGQIILALDLGRLLGLGPSRISSDSRLVIFKPSAGDSFGAIVDDLGEIVVVAAHDVEDRRTDDAAANSTAPADPAGLVASVAKIDAELLLVIAVRGLLSLVAEHMTCEG